MASTSDDGDLVSINDVLIDDCLLRLFAELPLAQQLGPLRAVCQRWRRLLETNILPTNHQSLKIFSSQDAGTIRDYCRSVTASFFSGEEDQQKELAINGDEIFVPSSLPSPVSLFNQLSALLPNLAQLTVWFDGDSSPLEQLPALFEAPNGLPNLVRLTLLGQIKNIFDPVSGQGRFLERLCRALNAYPKLTQLDLLPVNLLRSGAAVQILATQLTDLLPRLTGLSLKLFGCRAELVPLLSLLTPGRLKRLRLESMFFYQSEEIQAALLLSTRGLTASLEELRVSGVGRVFLRFIGVNGKTQFPALKRLSLGFAGLPQIEDLLCEELATDLPQLTDLTIENVLIGMNLSLSELTCLPAIRRLTLAGLDLGRFTFDDYRFLCILGTAFPGLEALTLRCVNSIDENDAIGAFQRAGHECFRLLRAEAVHLERDRWPRLAGKYHQEEAKKCAAGSAGSAGEK